ncbi:hypothetical protein PspLS_11423, partial [Pyricularia sp. CBS 133598]
LPVAQYQRFVTLAQMALESTAQTSETALTGDVLKFIAEKDPEFISEAVEHIAEPTGEVIDATKVVDEKVGTTTPDVAAQANRDIPKTNGTAAAAIVGAAGITMLVAPALIALPALGAVGFSASGPVAGSIAAAIQSGLGSVVAPSLFATFQSAAMGGYGAAAVFGAVQVGGGAMAASAIVRMKSWL